MEIPAAPRSTGLISVDGRAYPLESARVAAEASGGIALSTLVQTYRNPYAEPLEVIYTLPLPADGAVIGYTMRLGDRVIRGEVRSREAAKAAYEKALFEGRSAALLEQDRDDTFTQRLGSLPAGRTAEIAIEVLHPLAFLLGAGDESGPQWEYRFPTVVGVRYEGAPGRVPDANRLDVDRAAGAGEIPTRIELTLTTTDPAGSAVRRVETMPLDRDLVVRWPAAGREIGVHLVEGPGLPGDSGRYGLLTITPPRVSELTFARDLTILLDASGSMSGQPIEWAKTVAEGLLRSLTGGDRFEVIAFSGRPRSLTGGIVPAGDRTLGAVLKELAALQADGGTEMVEAVLEALRPLRPDSQHQVVLITDGDIGFEDEVVAQVVARLPEGARLHTVGVGAAPNRTLTSRAARAGRGVESFVCGDAAVPATVRRLLAATARPVLTDVMIATSAVRGIAPARPRDVLAGQPLVVALELQPGGGTIEVSGRLAGYNERWTCGLAVRPRGEAASAITAVPLGALYGRECIADCEMNGPQSSERVLEIALRHRIASRVTSLVAIADEPSVDPNAARRREELPVEMPAYMSAEAVGLGAPGSGLFDRMLMAESSAWRSRAEARPRFAPRVSLDFSRRIIPTPISNARVLAIEGELLVIEYESPHDGFVGPDGEIKVMVAGQALGSCRVDSARSSPRGPHAKGLLLRLAVRRPSGWSAGDLVALTWGDEVVVVFTIEPPA
jgi:Ca-activated chloride channel family protein